MLEISRLFAFLNQIVESSFFISDIYIQVSIMKMFYHVIISTSFPSTFLKFQARFHYLIRHDIYFTI